MFVSARPLTGAHLGISARRAPGPSRKPPAKLASPDSFIAADAFRTPASSGDFSTIQTELREVLDSCPSDKPDETKASLMALKQALRARHSYISKDAEKEIDKQITKASVSALQKFCKTIGNDQSKFDEALRIWVSISDKYAREEAQSFLAEAAAHNPTFISALAGRVERMRFLNLPSPSRASQPETVQQFFIKSEQISRFESICRVD